MSELEALWDRYADMLGLPPGEPEYTFARPRRFRFDRGYPFQRVAVELEGGQWVYGRHNRPAGFERDCEKYNIAAARGWRVFRFTRGMLERDPAGCVEIVRKALNE